MDGDKWWYVIAEGGRVRGLTQDGTKSRGTVRKLEITWCISNNLVDGMKREKQCLLAPYSPLSCVNS